MLEGQGLRPDQIDLIAVSHGPGSFTGLRLGIVIAKTWSWSAGIPVVGVDTLAGLAWTAFRQSIPEGTTQPPAGIDGPRIHVRVATDAQRGQYFAADYLVTAAGPIATQPCWIANREELVQNLAASQPLVLPESLRWQAGSVIPESVIPESGTLESGTLEIAPTLLRVAVSAQSIGELGQLGFDQRGGDDPFALVPRYVRASAAEEKAGI